MVDVPRDHEQDEPLRMTPTDRAKEKPATVVPACVSDLIERIGPEDDPSLTYEANDVRQLMTDTVLVYRKEREDQADLPRLDEAFALTSKARGFANWLRSGNGGDIRPEPADYEELANMIRTLAVALSAKPRAGRLPGQMDDVRRTARRFMGLFHADGEPPHLTTEDIDHSELAQAYDALDKALTVAFDGTAITEETSPGYGWLYHNPDAGTEWSPNHPVESGEVDDATDVRAATEIELHRELVSAWKALEEERQIRKSSSRARTERSDRQTMDSEEVEDLDPKACISQLEAKLNDAQLKAALQTSVDAMEAAHAGVLSWPRMVREALVIARSTLSNGKPVEENRIQPEAILMGQVAQDIPAPTGEEEAVAWLTEWQFKPSQPDLLYPGGGSSLTTDARDAAAKLKQMEEWDRVDWVRQTALCALATSPSLRVENERLRSERDEVVARYAESVAEGLKLRELAERRRLTISAYMNDDPVKRASDAEARVMRLDAAAAPFLDFAEGLTPALADEMPMTKGSAFARRQVTVGDFRALRSALSICKPVKEKS